MVTPDGDKCILQKLGLFSIEIKNTHLDQELEELKDDPGEDRAAAVSLISSKSFKNLPCGSL